MYILSVSVRIYIYQNACLVRISTNGLNVTEDQDHSCKSTNNLLLLFQKLQFRPVKWSHSLLKRCLENKTIKNKQIKPKPWEDQNKSVKLIWVGIFTDTVLSFWHWKIHMKKQSFKVMSFTKGQMQWISISVLSISGLWSTNTQYDNEISSSKASLQQWQIFLTTLWLKDSEHFLYLFSTLIKMSKVHSWILPKV